jgi:hypothetical protein
MSLASLTSSVLWIFKIRQKQGDLYCPYGAEKSPKAPTKRNPSKNSNEQIPPLLLRRRRRKRAIISLVARPNITKGVSWCQVEVK